MTKIWTIIRHNQGLAIGSVIAFCVLFWTYGCPSRVTSILNPPKLVTRAELEVEVDYWLKTAEIRFSELDQQDEFKRTIFAFAIDFMKGGQINPVALAVVLGNILGLGAIIDNRRKDVIIKTLK